MALKKYDLKHNSLPYLTAEVIKIHWDAVSKYIILYLLLAILIKDSIIKNWCLQHGVND